MRRFLPLIALLAACTSTDARCHQIALDQLVSELDVSAASDIQQAFGHRWLPAATQRYGAHWADSTWRPLYDSLQRVMRAERHPGDTSAPTMTPPPRPSDIAWSAEHCYDGKARP
jgi:hypothetical protein